MNICIDEVAAVIKRHRFKYKKYAIVNIMERYDFMKQSVLYMKNKYNVAENPRLPSTGEYVDYIGESYYIFGKSEWGHTTVVEDPTTASITMTVIKNRYWRYTHDYDIVKLWCYMAIYGKLTGHMVEIFPVDSAMTERRCTIAWNDTEWAGIDCELNMVALELLTMTDNEVRKYIANAYA